MSRVVGLVILAVMYGTVHTHPFVRHRVRSRTRHGSAARDIACIYIACTRELTETYMHTRTDSDLYTGAIDRLVDYYGSYERPARILNVSTTDLHRWAHGEGRPSTDVFVKVLYLNEESWKR
jgi:hypothetical protein